MLIPVLLFIVGLLCLIKGGDWFVDGATGVARRFHVPELLIGATVVSIGTALPEVMVSTTSAFTVRRHAIIPGSAAMEFVKAAAEDAYDRLIFPSLEREARSELTASACEGAIGQFALNLLCPKGTPPWRAPNFFPV